MLNSCVMYHNTGLLNVTLTFEITIFLELMWGQTSRFSPSIEALSKLNLLTLRKD